MRRGGSDEQMQQNTRQKGKTMSAATTHTNDTTHTAGFPPAPSEAHQRAVGNDDTRIVVMNGSRIVMKHDGHQWRNVSVTPAAL